MADKRRSFFDDPENAARPESRRQHAPAPSGRSGWVTMLVVVVAVVVTVAAGLLLYQKQKHREQLALEEAAQRTTRWLGRIDAEVFHKVYKDTVVHTAAAEPRRDDAGRATADYDRALHSFAEGHYADSERLHRSALEIRENVLGPNSPIVAESLNGLAVLYCVMRRYSEAELLARRALDIRQKAGGTAQPEVAQSLTTLAAVYSHQGRYAEAEALSRQALATWDRTGEKGTPRVDALNVLAALYAAQGRYAEAAQFAREGLRVLETPGPAGGLGGPGPPGRSIWKLAPSLNLVAELNNALGRHGESERLSRRALEMARSAGPGLELVQAESLSILAKAHAAQGRYPEAEGELRAALRLIEASPPNRGWQPSRALHAIVLENLARVYRALGKSREAEDAMARAAMLWTMQ